MWFWYALYDVVISKTNLYVLKSQFDFYTSRKAILDVFVAGKVYSNNFNYEKPVKAKAMSIHLPFYILYDS